MKIDLFFQKFDLLRDLVAGMFDNLGSQRWKRVDILMLMLTMSVYYQAKGQRQPFASARWYAGNCFCSEKTVDRLVNWLKLEGFARVRRLRRRDTQALWEKQNQKGWNNEGWQELANMNGGPTGPFKIYPEGFYSTNEIDLRPLLRKLARLLGMLLNRQVEQWRVYSGPGGICCKAWEPVDWSVDHPGWLVEEFLPLQPG